MPLDSNELSPIVPPPTGPDREISVPRSPVRQRLGRLWSGASRASLFVVLSFVLWWLFAWALAEQAWIENQLMWTVFSLFPAALVTTILLLRTGPSHSLAEICLPGGPPAIQDTGLGIALGMGVGLAVSGIQYAAGWVAFNPVAEVWPPSSEGNFVWTPSLGIGLAVIALGSAGEELLFRGYGLQQLIRATNPWFAVLGTSAVFGIMHRGNPDASPVGIVNTVLFGVLFGFALVRHRTLWLPLGMHFGWNATLATIGANVSGLRIRLAGFELVPSGPAIWSGADYGPEASLLASFAVAAAGLVLWKIPPRRQGPRLWD
jgi:membrane protease YdiL (CAAX protease family)